MIALTAGELGWDEGAQEFDSMRSTAVPAALRGAFREEPRWVDFRWARTMEDVSLRNPGFRDRVADLAAALHGSPKEDLVGEDVRQHRRAVRLAWGAILSLLILTIASVLLGSLAVRQRNIAAEQARLALSRQLAAQATASFEDRLDLGLLLAVEAVQTIDTVQARSALLQGLAQEPKLVTMVRGPRSAQISGDGETLAVATGSRVTVWSLTEDRLLSTIAFAEAKASTIGLSHDGAMLAVVQGSDLIRVWDVRQREPVSTITNEGNTGAVSATVFWGDGSLLATPGRDGTLKIWGTLGGELLAEHRLPVSDFFDQPVEASPDGAWLLAGGNDGLVVGCDAGGMEPECRPVLKLNHPIEDVVWSEDSSHFAVDEGLDIGSRVLVCDLLSEAGCHAYPGASSPVVFSPDGRHVAAADGDGFSVWNVGTGGKVGADAHAQRGGTSALAFSGDGQMIAAGGGGYAEATIDGWAVLCSIGVGSLPCEPLPLANHAVRDLAFGPGDRVLAAATGTARGIEGLVGDVLLWRATSGRSLGEPLGGHSTEVGDVSFGAGGKRLVSVAGTTGSPSGEVRVWDLARTHRLGKRIAELGDLVTDVSISPDGLLAAVASESYLPTRVESAVSVWDLEHEELIAELQGVRAPISISRPRRLVTATDARTGELVTWDLRAERFVHSPLAGASGPVASTASGSHTAAYVPGEPRGSVSVWNTRGKQIASNIPVTEDGAQSLALSPDAELLAIGSSNVVRLWDLQQRRHLQMSFRHAGPIAAVVFSPNGNRLAVGSAQQTDLGVHGEIRLWDLETGNLLATQPTSFGALAFSPDGSVLVAGNAEGSLQVWDAETGEALGHLQSKNRQAVEALEFTPEGSLVAGRLGELFLWQLKLPQWEAEACRVANRNLTRDEWAEFIGEGRPYGETCATA